MSAAVALVFVEAINRHDPARIADLMTPDHVFIDSLGTKVAGREQMRQGWQSYLKMVPDYTIAVQETFINESVVVMLGRAGGTYAPGGPLLPENRWQTPVALRAVVRGSLIAEWRVYADNEPMRRLMLSR